MRSEQRMLRNVLEIDVQVQLLVACNTESCAEARPATLVRPKGSSPRLD